MPLRWHVNKGTRGVEPLVIWLDIETNVSMLGQIVGGSAPRLMEQLLGCTDTQVRF